MMFLFGNPTRSSGRFYDCFHSKAKFRILRKVDSRTCQITNKKQIEQWLEEYGDDSDFFQVRLRGEFPNASSAQFFPTNTVREAMERSGGGLRASMALMGVDLARTKSQE